MLVALSVFAGTTTFYTLDGKGLSMNDKTLGTFSAGGAYVDAGTVLGTLLDGVR